jgi:arylsulfatase A-like enzyme
MVSAPARRHWPDARRVVLALAGILLPACGAGEAPPGWVSLARGCKPEALLPLARRWHAEAGMDAAECGDESTFVRVRHPMPRSAWERAGDQGDESDTWIAAMPGGAFAYGAPSFLQLRSGDQPIVSVPDGRELAPRTFRLESGRLHLRLTGGAEPPADLVLVQRMESGRLPADGVWQVRIGDEFGSGIPVWSGEREELACALPAASRLSFEARYLSRQEGTVRLRVRLDGEVVHESSEDSRRLLEEGRWHSFALPPAARAEARFTFEAEGPTGQALFLRPVIGPVEVGSYGARPWQAARPDVVVFLADTFRADALAPTGGPPDLAPALERFAAGALRFRNARSNASWTLPSISTLLTGLAPGQHTANDMNRALPDDLVTVIEALSRSGYRTCAVTDAAFFSPTFGLEQGFESFAIREPRRWDLDWTIQRALEHLDRDDGRPLFLLVHTYRTHMPYRTGPEEDIRPWEELIASGCALLKSRGKTTREEWRERLARCRQRFEELYREGVRDLDRGFGECLAALERRGAGRGFVIFTSDHGEALGENEDIFHDGKQWESKLRIPLLVRGPGLAPRDVDRAVTLLDLAPTLAQIAGLPREPAWPGESLLSVAGDRPACAFLLKKAPEIALVDGGRKLFAAGPDQLERGAYGSAYDLARDPHEERPVTGEAWPGELARRHAALVRALLAPASTAVEIPLSVAQQRELGELGYGGGDEEQ